MRCQYLLYMYTYVTYTYDMYIDAYLHMDLDLYISVVVTMLYTVAIAKDIST